MRTASLKEGTRCWILWLEACGLSPNVLTGRTEELVHSN